MKLTLLLLSLTSMASGFSPVPSAKIPTTPLNAAFTGKPGNGWSDKPAFKKESTEPVAAKKVSWFERQMMEDVMIDPDFFLTFGVAILCPLIIWYHPSYAPNGGISMIGLCGGLFHLLFAALLWVQTLRVRCVFEKDAFEFYNIKGPKLDLENGAYLEKKPDNYVAGTQNRWKYDSITNYGFFPSEEFPVICYFKETDTPEWKWNRWFAAFDSYGRGQPHFFPGICNVKQFKAQMEARGVKRKHVPSLKDLGKKE